ncbi:MAG: DUF1998 domain-containing protein [Carnobacterium sp.]|uniref:Zn-binding domain-containing protein n=1 Tax=Carnobacterium sp. TaxID=48221 RepID=UPI003C77EEC4
MKSDIQRGSLIGQQGPGSLYINTDGSSYIISAADKWYNREIQNKYIREDLLEIHDKRLEKILKVNKFLRVPEYRVTYDKENAINTGLQVPVNRFPLLEYCSTCGTFRTAKPEFPNKKRQCSNCQKQRVFIQFPIIIMCKHGHISDFPHYNYAHKDKEHKGSKNSRLWLDKTGPSLLSWTVRCECGSSHSLAGVTGKSNDEERTSPYKKEMNGARCFGKMPWTGDKTSHECEEIPIAVLRNALSVYRPETVTALSISDNEDVDSDTTMEELYEQEFDCLNGEIINENQEKLKIKKSFNTDNHSIIKSVNFIYRLQEVVVQTNFHRETPPDDLESFDNARTGIKESMIFSSDYEKRHWYPAKIVFGEGIFIEFNSDILEEWEQKEAVTSRWLIIKNRVQEDFHLLGRFKQASDIMLHTVSHALIKELSKHSGYPMTSIRERLYLQKGKKGILLYVTDPDKAGTYGGLVRLAKQSKFKELFSNAINNLEWCSSDPVCYELGETPGQGIQHSNGSACHNCGFVPSTSCGSRNCFLDRNFISRNESDSVITKYFEWFDGNLNDRHKSSQKKNNDIKVEVLEEGTDLHEDYSTWIEAKALIDEAITTSLPLAEYFEGVVQIEGQEFEAKFIWNKLKKIYLFEGQDILPQYFGKHNEWEILEKM